MAYQPPQHIRPLALAVIRNNNAILVHKGYDSIKQQYYYRPLGGGIEFGETYLDAIRREIQEEIGAELCNINLLMWVENIFTYEGKQGHEIIALCNADFTNTELYLAPHINGVEGTREFIAEWKTAEDFTEETPLYPTQLFALLFGE
ncbi:MAG: NUDIX domain-containing protein [Bacteriodetes bacterium]|nr:NUDIX domain-containing protein [Bacteroidota bacterium]